MLLPAEALLSRGTWEDLAEVFARTRFAGTAEQMRVIVAETRDLRSGVLVHDHSLPKPVAEPFDVGPALAAGKVHPAD